MGWACVLFKRTQHSAFFCKILQKNVGFFAFFYILCKRMLRSLHSFTFIAKESCILCILLHSYEKNAKERIVFWVSQVAKNLKKECKRTLRSLKERKRTMRSERKRLRCPTMFFKFLHRALFAYFVMDYWTLQ